MPATRKQLILLGLVVLLSAAALVAAKDKKQKHPVTSYAAPAAGRWKTTNGLSTR